ncbi:SpoIIAA-like [Salegentibacter echinorum]|uniref:SpoIIAA-like n=1 Tax=Salegentibacter echinorum TaxID=1073325 RepID=A0A1M5I9M2_SALEC|nr:STAS/SEC14 domain-containing protein [Salegentibacter echinorum]SHG24927.1 SpoIIAA-like [Salegentibacter echinorum]
MYDRVSFFELSDHVVGLIIKSDINEHTVAEMHRQIREKIDEYDKINLFIEIEKGAKIELKPLFKDLKFKFNNAEHLKKMAVVTELYWFSNVLNIKDLMMEADIRTFEHENRLEALNWIAE